MRLTTGFVAVAALTAAIYGVGIAVAADPAPPEGAAPPAAAAPAVPPTAVVVTVNGVAITRADLDRAIEAFLAQSRMQAPTDPEQRKKMEAAAQDQMIAEEVLYQAAQKVEPPDLDKEIAAKFDEMKGQFPTPEDFEKTLKSHAMSEERLKDLLRRDVLIGSYIKTQVTAKVTVAAEQTRKFYDENLERFSKPESVRASHILIGVDPKATAEEKQTARKKADDLLVQVKGGADFAEVAKKESSCPSAKKGGDLGEFSQGQMVKPFEEVAFGLKQNELSGVVETQFGYHIIKATGRTEAGTVPFDQVKEKIEEHLKEVAVQKQVMAEVAALKKAAKIETPTPKS